MANNKVQLADGTILIDITGTTATADKILEGYGAFGADGVWMDGVAVAGAGSAIVVTDTLDENGGTIRNIDAVSLEGDTVRPDVLLSGYTAHNSLGRPIVGTASGGGTASLQAKAHIEPSESVQTITPDAGYDGLSSVQIDPIDSDYIGSDVTRRSSSDLTVSGAAVTVPSGYYSTQASKSVANGTAGTPSATKGTVANHSVSVTPSVINSAGYISGGTKTGTAVTVSASELVSGSETKTENGTYDVTNLAELIVDVPDSGDSSMNVQVAQSTTRIASTSYSEACSLICSKTGTYDVYWDCYRSTTSGTSGSRLYIGGSTYGSANTTFSNHAQNNHLTGIHISANQEVSVYARSRATNYYAYVGSLTIVQTA